MLRKLHKGRAGHHPLGRELRLLLRSQVFKGDELGWVELSQEWQRAFEAKGRIKAPNSEVVDDV